MSNQTRHRCAWTALIALAAIVGCGNNHNGNGTSGTGANGAGEAATVEITEGHAFSPREVTVRAGDAVVWKNKSNKIHTVSADPARAMKKESVSVPSGAKPFHSGEIQPGRIWRATFTVPGTYQYVCTLHEDHGMKATVIVRPSSDNNTPSPY